MPTRTIFFHISPLAQALFYALSFVSLAVCFWGLLRRVKLWRQGQPTPPVRDWPARLTTLFDQAVAHRRTRRRKAAGGMHILIFFGMVALFVGTTIVAIEHYGALLFGPHWLYKGAFYLVCKTTLDLFGLGLLIGTLMALARRYGARRPR